MAFKIRLGMVRIGVSIGKPAGRNLLPLHHPHNNGGNADTKTLNGANTKALNGEITNGEITSWLQTLCKSDLAATLQDSGTFVDFFSGFVCRHKRMSCTRRGVKTEPLVARTFFSSCQCREHLSTFNLHTDMRVALDMMGTCCTSARML